MIVLYRGAAGLARGVSRAGRLVDCENHVKGKYEFYKNRFPLIFILTLLLVGFVCVMIYNQRAGFETATAPPFHDIEDLQRKDHRAQISMSWAFLSVMVSYAPNIYQAQLKLISKRLFAIMFQRRPA